MPKKNNINTIPDFKINLSTYDSIQDIENTIVDAESFHTRIVHFILDRMYGEDLLDNNILCYFVDENENKYTTYLESDGYKKALNKSLKYFIKNENYENCLIIKKLLKLV